MRRSFGLMWATIATVLAVVSGGTAQGVALPAPAAGETYTNPVSDAFTNHFADPTVIRGRDGYWYAYSTGGTQSPDDSYHRMLIGRSPDLVTWEYVGDVFTEETEPRYDGKGDGPGVRRMFWAPAVEYFGGRYLLYYSYVVNDGSDRSWRAIGVATAPTPAGPWTDSGQYVTGPETWEPRPGVTGWRNVIDPEVATGPDGQRYLFYGSVLGGVRVVRLSADGLRAVGERVQLTPENRYEAAYLVHRDGWYYLFLSVIGGCCAGPASAYPLVVARSRSPLGPFVDRDGHPVAGRYAGGTPVQVPNGNEWVSVAHNTMATDLSGQDWLVTHGLDRTDPYRFGRANARRLMLSRLDWIDGWPVARAGAGLPDGAVPAPATEGIVVDAFESGDAPGDAWEPAAGWSLRREDAGGYLHTDGDGDGDGVALSSARALQGDVRARLASRLAPGDAGAAGLTLADHDGGGGVRVAIDRAAGALTVEVRFGGRRVGLDRQELPESFRYDDWHDVAVEVRDGRLTAEVTDVGQYDPVAIASATLPDGLAAGPLSLVASGTAADFDDVTAARLHTPVTTRVADPEIGTADPSYAEEFDGPLGPAWRWVRDPAATTDDGALAFPVQQTSLVDRRPTPDDTASVLLRDAPPGEWTAETKVTVPFGDSLPYGWPRAGLIAYAGDDEWVTLGYGTRVDPRFASFGKETTYQGGPPIRGHAALGPTADTMWLRLRHTVDPANGEHEYRAATSLDGEHWVWHGVRVLPAGPQPPIGLIAFDGEDDPTDATDDLTAHFEYLRFHRP